MQRVAITGASGLIGSALVGNLKSEGYTVQRLVRRPIVSSEGIFWNPSTQEIHPAALAGVDAVIHLAGAGVGDKRWTKKYKAAILNSRLLGTTTIANAVAQVKPKVFISSSAIGWYGETVNRAVT
jgi:NAD dependent epimerase/dehydratase family enzyme